MYIRNFKFAFLIIAIPFVALFSPQLAHAEHPSTGQTLIINTPVFPPYTTADAHGFEDELIREVFRRLDIDINIVHVPAERGLQNLNSGHDDGIMSRIAGLSAAYPNIVQFDESAIVWDFVAFARDDNIQVSDWQGLAPYSVAIVTGWKILEANSTHSRNVVKVREAKQLFHLLDSGRVDLALFARLPGTWLVRELGLKNIRVLEPPLARREKYFYLHMRHRALIAPADDALRKIKNDGTYEEILAKTLN